MGKTIIPSTSKKFLDMIEQGKTTNNFEYQTEVYSSLSQIIKM